MKHKAQPVAKPNRLNLKQRLGEGLFIINSTIALFLLFAFLSYNPAAGATYNIGGRVGNILAIYTFKLFGYEAYLLPPLLVYWGWIYWQGQFAKPKQGYSLWLLQGLGALMTIIAGCGLNTLIYHPVYMLYHYGGLLGGIVVNRLIGLFNFLGAQLLLWALLLIGITLTTGFSWLSLIDKLGQGALSLVAQWQLGYRRLKKRLSQKRISVKLDTPPFDTVQRTNSKAPLPVLHITPNNHNTPSSKPSVSKPQQPSPSPSDIHAYQAALSLELLDPAETIVPAAYSNEELETLSRNVELRLKDFGIIVHVVAVYPGPVITRFEMQLAAGIKVSRISSLAKDLARSLSVISVRIVEVIPGKPVVGLELPNRHREIVRLRTILNSQPYKQARSPLSLALGKDIAGHPVIVDLAKMPHLLVAGTTGSGKSVGLNAMLLSFLYKATPEQVRLIMIDPKMLELAIYEGIPHLLAPVVTDMKEAANALRWCVAEMERRYKFMATLGVRNLSSYNQRVQEAQNQGKTLTHPSWRPEQGSTPERLTPLPYIIVLVDEFADMMMVVGKKVEDLIARIAQKARAAGIHLILATQRPSVDVITGLIKANVPTRIAFQVSSKIDSRTILDQQGAEQLLGHGDMLYLAPGTGLPMRIHGAFVADHEVHNVVNTLKQSGAPDYMLAITEGTSELIEDTTESPASLSEKDPLYDQAVKIVLTTRRASISAVQRRLKIGYNRAARLIEVMEQAGIVGAMENNGNREILIPAHDEDIA